MKYLKVIIVLVLVFAAGVAVGVVATRYVIKRDIRRAVFQPELVRHRIERELTRELSLTPEQQGRVDAILVKLQQDIAAARKERAPRIRPLFAEAQNGIFAILTPEQQEKFERLQAEFGLFSAGGDPGRAFPRLQRLRKAREEAKPAPVSPPAPPEPQPANQPAVTP